MRDALLHIVWDFPEQLLCQPVVSLLTSPGLQGHLGRITPLQLRSCTTSQRHSLMHAQGFAQLQLPTGEMRKERTVAHELPFQLIAILPSRPGRKCHLGKVLSLLLVDPASSD